MRCSAAIRVIQRSDIKDMRGAGRGARDEWWAVLKSAWREKLDEHDHRAKRGTTIPRKSRLRARASRPAPRVAPLTLRLGPGYFSALSESFHEVGRLWNARTCRFCCFSGSWC